MQSRSPIRAARRPPPLPLFVYGSLRCGHRAHRRYCRSLAAVIPATAWGRCRQLASGYPILHLPPRAILAAAGPSPERDAELAAQIAVPPAWDRRPPGDWRPIAGELLLLTDPGRALPAIDRYEGCHPGSRGPYRRVLTAVATAAGPRLAWAYCAAGRAAAQRR